MIHAKYLHASFPSGAVRSPSEGPRPAQRRPPGPAGAGRRGQCAPPPFPLPVQVLFLSFTGSGGGRRLGPPGLWSPVLEKSGEGRLPRTSFGDLSPAQKWMGRASELRVGALSPFVPLPAPRDLV